MEASIALVVLTAAVFHATWNAMVKTGSDHLLSIAGLNFARCLIAILILPIVGFSEVASWPYLLASTVLHVGYYIALSEAYKYGDFSEAYPIARGTAPIIVSLFGVFVLQEALSRIELISLVGVILGILIFATRKFGQLVKHRQALLAALITSIFIGAYTVTDGIGGRLSENILGYMAVLSILDGSAITVYAVWKRGISEVIRFKSNWTVLLPGAILAFVSYTMVVWSMTQAPIALVSALRETSIIIAALIGAYYFKEPSGSRRIIASIIICASIALLGFDDS